MPELLARPTFAEILDRVRNDMNSRSDGTDARLRRTLHYVLSYVIAGVAHTLYGYIENNVAKQLLPDLASSTNLRRHAAIWGLTNPGGIPAAKAAGLMTFTALDGTVVPAGTVVARTDGVEVETDAEVTFTGTEEDIDVTAVLAGDDGNAEVGTFHYLSEPIEGLDSFCVVKADPVTGLGLTGGADLETDAELRERVLLRIQETPQGGADADYKEWAQTVSGVDNVWVKPWGLGAGTVLVYFTMEGTGSDIIPEAADVTAVQAAIDAERPVTADVTVAAPSELAVDMTIALDTDTAAARTAVEDELEAMLTREIEDRGDDDPITIKNSLFRAAIARGATDEAYTLDSIDGDGDGLSDISVDIDEVPTLGTITWA